MAQHLYDKDIKTSWLRKMAERDGSLLTVHLSYDGIGIQLSLANHMSDNVIIYYLGDSVCALLIEEKSGQVVGFRLEGDMVQKDGKGG